MASRTPEELQTELGERIRRLRLRANLSQVDVAGRADVSPRAIRAIENGEGSSVMTLIKVLKALGAMDALDAIAAAPTVSPMALLERGNTPQRASRKR